MANDLVLRVSLPNDTSVSQSAFYSVGDIGPAGGIIFSVVATSSAYVANDFLYLEAASETYNSSGINGFGTRSAVNKLFLRYSMSAI